MRLEEKPDCTMCRSWTMTGCRLGDQHFPDEAPACPRFDLDYTIELAYVEKEPDA